MDIPEYVNKCGKEAIENYVRWYESDYNLNNHPQRFHYLQDEDGETVKFDLKTPWHNIIKIGERKKVKEEEVKKLKKHHDLITKLKAQVIGYNRRYKTIVQSAQKGDLLTAIHEEIIEFFGDWLNPKEVREALKNKGYLVKLTDLEIFFVQNKRTIDIKRKTTAEHAINSQLGTETGRLTARSEIFQYYFNEWRKSPNIKLARILLNILESAKLETKGSEIKLTIDGKIDIQATLEVKESMNRIKGRFALHSFIVSDVAYSMGYDPAKMITQLANGYYNIYTGFSSAPPKIKDKNEPYLSQLTRGYNWQEIEAFNDKNNSTDLKRIEEKEPDKRTLKHAEKTQKDLITRLDNLMNDIDKKKLLKGK